MKNRRRKKRFRWIPVLLILLIGWVVLVNSHIPERLGLRKPKADLLSGPPDREAAGVLVAGLEQAGLDTQGMEVYVIPMKGQDGNLGVVTVDAGIVALNTLSGISRDSFDQLLRDLDSIDVTRVAVDYQGNGESMFTLTVPTDVLQDYAQGKLDEKGLVPYVYGKVDLMAIRGELLQ